MQTPIWLLSGAYWIHMAATVVWLGGLFWMSAFFQTHTAQEGVSSAGQAWRLLRRFLSIAWLSLALLVGTGLLQMAANPNYQGTLALVNPWSRALLAKHVVVLLMAGLNGHLQWVQLPALERAMIAARGGTGDPQPMAASRMLRFHRLNLALGLLVLLLTAMARTA
jgi:putative copper export protein